MAVDPEAHRLTPQRLALLLAGLLVLAALTWWRLASRPEPKQLLTFSGPTMGTTYSVKIVAPAGRDIDREGLRESLESELAHVNHLMSTYDPGSEISRFNASQSTEPFPISKDTATVIAAALKVSEQTAGAFDITLGPIVNAYGFGPEERTETPSDEEIEELRKRVGFQKLDLQMNPPTLRKSRPDVYVDLSALAKGFGVDKLAGVLDQQEFTGYLVEIGGEVRAHGRNADGELWRIGIEKPVEGERAVERVVRLDNLAMATSGDYRNFYEENGKRISHEIDGRTGRPVTHNLASASVIHPQCMWADAYATAIMALGPDDGLLMAEILKLPALLIVREPNGSFVEVPSAAFAVQYGTDQDQARPEA